MFALWFFPIDYELLFEVVSRCALRLHVNTFIHEKVLYLQHCGSQCLQGICEHVCCSTPFKSYFQCECLCLRWMKGHQTWLYKEANANISSNQSKWESSALFIQLLFAFPFISCCEWPGCKDALWSVAYSPTTVYLHMD